MTVREAAPNPPPGPARDALLAVSAAQVRANEDAITTALEEHIKRVGAVVVARAKGPKARKGTKWWADSADAANTQLVGNVATIERKAIDAGYVVPDKFGDEAADAVRPVAMRIATRAAGDVAERLGIAPRDLEGDGLFAIDTQAVERAVEEAIQALLGSVDRHVQELRKQVLDADEKSDSLDEMVERIEEANQRGGKWLLMRGRDLAHALAQRAAWEQARALGVRSTQWLSKRDERVRPTHVEADGQVRPVNEQFKVGRWKLWHPGDPTDLPESWEEIANCFVAGTGVDAPDVEGSFRAPYVGEIVTIGTEAGHVLTGTPNHPVLTERGWVPLGELNEFDHVISARVSDHVQMGGDPDVEAYPALIEQVHDALAQVSPTQRVSGLAVNFHGDRSTGQVDIVATDRKLRVGRHAALDEKVGHHHLPGGGEGAHVGDSPRTTDPLVQAGLTPTRSLMGSIDQGESPSIIKIRPSSTQGVGASTWLNAATTQPVPDGATRDPKILGEQVLTLAGPIAAHDVIGIDIGASQGSKLASPPGAKIDHIGQSLVNEGDANSEGCGHLAEGLAGAVHLDRVVKVERSLFSGHVYTLQTSSGIFLANNIVTKNCRCTLLFARPSKATRDALKMMSERSSRADASVKRVLKAAQAATPVPTPSGMTGDASALTPSEPLIGYRVLDKLIDAVPGQRLVLPATVGFGLAAPAAFTATAPVLTILIPAGTAMTVVGGAVALAANTELEVLAVSDAGIEAQVVS